MMANRYPTEAEMEMLKSVIGGRSTLYGTPEHDAFMALSEFGWVKEAMFAPDGVSWKLSGDGLSFAYAAEARS